MTVCTVVPDCYSSTRTDCCLDCNFWGESKLLRDTEPPSRLGLYTDLKISISEAETAYNSAAYADEISVENRL